MSGFDPGWLDLREGADHRARNADVLAACASHFAGRAHASIVDLGCGLGSNLRALAPHLPQRQDWRLVDHDPVLLAAARERLRDWAHAAKDIDGVLHLERDGRSIAITFVEADLSHDAGAVLQGADLVTAAALFDLVSADWLARFVAALTYARTPFYTALTYNGVETWSPPDTRDAEMRAAFHAHQARDKGFGPSAGPRATEVLAQLFAAQGFSVLHGDSPWRLGPGDAALIASLADGVAGACMETGLVGSDTARGWRAAREGAQVVVGHTDLFARPG